MVKKMEKKVCLIWSCGYAINITMQGIVTDSLDGTGKELPAALLYVYWWCILTRCAETRLAISCAYLCGGQRGLFKSVKKGI
jgi:hypothetical protein